MLHPTGKALVIKPYRQSISVGQFLNDNVVTTMIISVAQ